MAKEAASVQLTGGAGFDFEDQVAAFFATGMLTGAQPLGAGVGGVRHLDWQTRESGWLLDDLLVSLSRPDGGRLALSIKSDRQVTAAGFPSSFVTAVWEQQLSKGTPASDFAPQSDLLGLVVGELANEVQEDWNELLRQALSLESSPARLAARYTNKVVSSAGGRALFASLRCPATVSTTSTDVELASLLSRVRLVHFDFTSPTSSNRANAVHLLQRSLQTGEAKEASLLWEALCRLCGRKRTAGGSLNRTELLAELRDQFKLTDPPDHAAAWASLQQRSREYAARAKLYLGDDVRLDRQEEVLKIKLRVLDKSAVLLNGSSGGGKSAISRALAEDTGFCSRFLWLDPDVVGDDTPSELQARLGSPMPLASLLAETAPSLSILILDGLDRFSPKGLTTVASLLGALSTPLGSSGWVVLATARADGLDELSSRLRQVGVGDFFVTLSVQPPSSSAIRSALEQIQGIRHLRLRPMVVQALKNLKVFDWVASVVHSGAQAASDSWVGMTDVLDWVWESWIGSGSGRINRANALKTLGTTEADTLPPGVGLLSIQQLGGEVVEQLQRLDLIRVHEERVLFTHDLVGDVARLRVLMDIGTDLTQLTAKVQHPRWHAAVRLLGQRLAERTAADNRPWKVAFEAADDTTTAGALYRNLLIEGVCVAVNAGQLVDLLWPDLAAGDGLVLRRLLEAFRYTATVPDARIRNINADAETVAALEANVRVPYWPYWLPMLAVLPAHAADLCRLALVETGHLVDLWLRTMPIGTTGRMEAATIALALAREVQAARGEGFRDDADKEEVIFQALLNAAQDLPDEVAQVCLELAQRRPEPDAVAERRRLYQAAEEKRLAEWVAKNPPNERKPFAGFSVFDEGIMTEALPDGPAARVDTAFQRTILGGASIASLATVRPAAAREVLVACALQPPHRVRFGGERNVLRRFGIESIDRHDPPFYSRGPWLAMLGVDAAITVGAIVRLVNHATESWAADEAPYRSDPSDEEHAFTPPGANVFVDGTQRRWVGDSRVFGWYRNHLIGSDTLVSALMALEKFLYDQLDAKRSIDSIARLIWDESSSVAMLGVLTAVTLRHPELLEGPLSPLLGVWQLHDWSHRVLWNEDVWRIEQMAWSRHGEVQFNLFVTWNTLEHRKIESLDRFLAAFLSRPAVQAAFADIRERWAKEAEHDEDSAPDIQRHLARFDLKNYAFEQQKDHITVTFAWPEELKKETSEKTIEAHKSMAFLSFPTRCRKMLDKDVQLSDDEAEAVWKEMRQLSTFELKSKKDELFGPVRQRADIVAAGIAVLAILAREWLEREDGRVEWCGKELAAIQESPPQAPRYDIPESVTTDAWHCFLAELGVHWLSLDPKNESTRAWAAQGVMSRWHSTTRLAMARAERCRAKLGDDFPRLANLAALYAALLGTRHHIEETDAELRRLVIRYDRLVAAFVRGNIPAGPLDWVRVGRIGREAHERLDRKRWPAKYEKKAPEAASVGGGGADEGTSPQGQVRRGAPRRARPARVYPGYDLDVLKAAFGWLPKALATVGPDRRHALSCLQGLLSISLGMLPGAKNTDDPDDFDQSDGTPYNFDGWVFDLVVQAVPGLDIASATALWRPILDLGPGAHYWVESFCDSWHIHGPENSPSRQEFFDRWNEMLLHAESSPIWSPTGAAHFRLRGLWERLLGMGVDVRVVGAKENEPFLAQMVPTYQRWASRWLRDSLSVRSFGQLLSQPGAKPLRLASLPWLLAAVQSYTEDNRNRNDVDDLLVRVLRQVWGESSIQLVAAADSRRSFLDLVSLLAADQNADALHLRDTVARAMGL